VQSDIINAEMGPHEKRNCDSAQEQSPPTSHVGASGNRNPIHWCLKYKYCAKVEWNINHLLTYWNSLQCLILLVRWQEGHQAYKKGGCWIVGGDDLTSVLQSFQLQLSPQYPSSLAPINSRMETFWYRQTQIHLEKGCWNGDSQLKITAHWLSGC